MKPGSPGATSTSTRTGRPSRPWSVAARTLASMGRTVAAAAHRPLSAPLIARLARVPRSRLGGRGSASPPRRSGARRRRSIARASSWNERPSGESDFVNMTGAPELRALIAPRYSLSTCRSIGRLQGALGRLRVDPRERVRAVQDELDPLALVADVAERLEDQADVLEAREVGRQHDVQVVGGVEHAEVRCRRAACRRRPRRSRRSPAGRR